MDIELIETKNGGDLVKNNRDLSVIEGFQNMAYLGMFGGNVEQSTPLIKKQGEHLFDWWGNNLLFQNDESVQFNSLTERTLNKVVLNSAGRIDIEQAVKTDLDFMKPFANVSVSVMIIGLDRIAIAILIIKPDNLDSRLYVYIWDKTILELTMVEGNAASRQVVIDGGIFSIVFDESFN